MRNNPSRHAGDASSADGMQAHAAQAVPIPGPPTIRLLSALKRSVFIIVALGAVLTLLLLVRVAYEHDRIAAEASRGMFLGLTALQARQISVNLRDYTHWDEAIDRLPGAYDPEWWYSNAGAFAVDTFDLSFSMAVDGTDRLRLLSTPEDMLVDPPADIITPSLRALFADARARPDSPLPEMSTVTGYAVFDGTLHLVAASRYMPELEDSPPNPDPRALLVYARSVEDGLLPKSAEIMGATDMRLVEVTSGTGNRVPLTLANGREAGAVAWTPAQPGRAMVTDLAVPISVSYLAVTLLVLGFVRRGRQLALKLHADEHRRQQLALRNQAILEAAGEGIFGTDGDTRIVFVNPAALAAFGYHFDEFIGRDARHLFHRPRSEKSPPEEICPLRRVLADGEPRGSDTELFVRRDGTGFPVEYLITAMREADRVTGAVIVFRDISERKRTQQQLSVQSSALEAAANPIFITDSKGSIKWANTAFIESSGYSLPEIRGKRPGDLIGSGRQEQTFYKRLWATILAGEVWRGQLVNRRKNGELRTEEMTVTPVKDERGAITHFVAVKQDITDRLALEEQLQRSQRLESVGQLTGGIAHDFNNLLTVIQGNAELLEEELATDPRLRPIAGMVIQGAQRGAELTHRLLAFARKQPLEPKAVDVNQLLDGMHGLLRRTLGEQVEIEFTPDTELWLALVDAGQLESAVLNLCLNSRDAMPQGGRLTIETRNTELDRTYADVQLEVEPGQYVLVAVSDTGTGIPPEHLARVFDPFYTTKDKGKGTGLGLSMVYGFIKQSRGHVKIYSEPGQGTTVKMYLPRVVSDTEPASESVTEVKVSGGNDTILLVEDNELVRVFATTQLQSLGYRVLTAIDGPAALTMIQAHEEIDLLFTDIVMPGGMSGRELADAACKIRPGLKVLYTSGYTENAIVHHGRLDPGVLLLSKPYRRAELAHRIRQALDGTGETPS